VVHAWNIGSCLCTPIVRYGSFGCMHTRQLSFYIHKILFYVHIREWGIRTNKGWRQWFYLRLVPIMWVNKLFFLWSNRDLTGKLVHEFWCH
jgi:hypothetical protein